METPDVPAALAAARARPRPSARSTLDEASYFLSTIELRARRRPGDGPLAQAPVPRHVTITADAAEYFGLPRDRTVIMGSRVEV